MSEIVLTPQQQQAIDTYRTGDSMVLSAYAGTGKTTTILQLAASSQKSGTYVAYNRAIVDDVQRVLRVAAPHVRARTAHSLAFRDVGVNFKSRLGNKRIASSEVAKLLHIAPLDVTARGHTHRLSPSFLAGCVMDAMRIYCNSADLEPMGSHLPAIEAIDENGESENDAAYRDHLEGALADAWADLSHEAGLLRFSHDCYLKIWQLSQPTIDGDVIFVDEAQDVNPVLAAVIEAQRAQIVAVGDSFQQIYEWRGAIDSLAKLAKRPGFVSGMLTWSFRFGNEIAEVANDLLMKLGALTGVEGMGGPSAVGHSPWPDAILCRTNAGVITALFDNLESRQCSIVGGGGELVAFARGYARLRDTGHSPHPELCCFAGIDELHAYVTDDPSGSDLALMVKLCSSYGPEEIIEAVGCTVPEATPDSLTISTAHKAKGREWPAVRLAADWTAKRLDNAEELRLAYVAVTRAASVLDLTECGL